MLVLLFVLLEICVCTCDEIRYLNDDAGNRGVYTVKFMKESYPELYSNQYEGDIVLFDDKTEEGKNAVRDESQRWPDATIPYVIGPNFTEEDRGKILQAMYRLQNETCIKFVPRNYEKQYIYINNQKAGCYAVIGYHWNANKPHPVNFETPGCMKHQGTIEHEFLHIIGLYHEQSRADRDDHVHIYWGNITDEYKSNFDKQSGWVTTVYQVPYDINSVMHYPRFSFSKNGNETIIYKKDPNMKLGQRVGATQGDLEKVRKMYSCNGTYSNMKPYGSPEWMINQVNAFFKEPKYPNTQKNHRI